MSFPRALPSLCTFPSLRLLRPTFVVLKDLLLVGTWKEVIARMRRPAFLLLALALLSTGAFADSLPRHEDGGKAPSTPSSMQHDSGMDKGAEHGGAHGHHDNNNLSPLLVLNETELLLTHAPDPLSYWAHDRGFALVVGSDGLNMLVPTTEGEDGEKERVYGGLMVVHVACMVVAFFGVLPIGASTLLVVSLPMLFHL